MSRYWAGFVFSCASGLVSRLTLSYLNLKRGRVFLDIIGALSRYSPVILSQNWGQLRTNCNRSSSVSSTELFVSSICHEGKQPRRIPLVSFEKDPTPDLFLTWIGQGKDFKLWISPWKHLTLRTSRQTVMFVITGQHVCYNRPTRLFVCFLNKLHNLKVCAN